jgi:type I restriction enzyme R subunit
MSERRGVQQPMLRYASAIGWEYVKPDTALRLRGDDTSIYFADVLRTQLLRLNPGIVDAARADDILRQLNLLRSTMEGNRDALTWLRGLQSVFVPDQNRELNVRLVDFDSPTHNVFQVTDEWVQRGVVYRNRADIVFLINGIPVAVAETKNATKVNGIAEGITQVRRYQEETPELFTATQVFEVTQLLDFWYGATWNTSRKDLFNWKEVEPGNYEQKVRRFFDRPTFLRLLHDYILFLTKDDVLTKVILRQHQMRAVEKVVERVADATKRRGLIWHTQGSGKTYTMLTIAAKLLRAPAGEKPLVLMLVDRNELEQQLFKNITAYGIGTVRVAGSKHELRDLLASDYRGLVVSMMHKFDGIPANVNTGSHVVVLVDEAHRTTGGDLGNYLLGALPNATYIGFTGTPVDRLARGQGTFKVFGPDDPQGYLDKYNIAESIEDGTTVRLNYALAPSDLRVDRAVLDREFLFPAQAEGIADVEELNALLDKAVLLKELMKARERMARIARYVAQDFQERIWPMGFKAFLVAVDREACALYKQLLDNYLPPEWSVPVYSPVHNDTGLLRQYALSEDQEKEVRRAFLKKDQNPRLLIVTEKLLTGYDAPILYCLYLDKPMRDHVLLQAIARVNRPYEDEEGLVKPYGLVVDFVGIFERLEAALAFDSDTVASVIQNVDVLKQLFAKWMAEDAQAYLPYARGWDDKAKERAIAHFEDKARRDEFFTFARQLQNLYEVLSPDAFLRPYIEQYQALMELYALLRNAFSERTYTDPDVAAKTRQLLREHSTSTYLSLPGAIHELGPQELAALKASDIGDEVKVLNLRKVLAATVARDGMAQPFLLSIGERAEALAQAYEDRHMTTQQVLEQFEQLALVFVEADAEREQLGLDPNAFAVYTVLKPLMAATLTPKQAQEVNAVFVAHPDYRWDAKEEQAVRAQLYKVLPPLVGAKHIVDAANSLLRLQRV